MDGTFAGDGPGPRCMIPYAKNVILASSDQFAIDAVAAKLMGFDPLSIKFIRLAHDLGLGCGDPRDIEIVGDRAEAKKPRHFVGPFNKMAFASRMQHKIYWEPLKKPVEWSLKTFLAPWAYIASVLYHDCFWYPFKAKKQMAKVLESPSARLFRDWERWSEGGVDCLGSAAQPARLCQTGAKAFWTSLKILMTCIREAPELAIRRRKQLRGSSPGTGQIASPSCAEDSHLAKSR